MIRKMRIINRKERVTRVIFPGKDVKLTIKQKKLADKYIISGNATEAAENL